MSGWKDIFVSADVKCQVEKAELKNMLFVDAIVLRIVSKIF
jgi:hypothetical protein